MTNDELISVLKEYPKGTEVVLSIPVSEHINGGFIIGLAEKQITNVECKEDTVRLKTTRIKFENKKT